MESHESTPNSPKEVEERAEEDRRREKTQKQQEKQEEKSLVASSPHSEEDHSKMALSDDPTKVKFTKNNESAAADSDGGGNRNGEAKVDIENVQLAFAGMGKEELMAYADDPYWVRLRWTLFALFWILWAAMLVGAVAIVVTTPGCPPLPARQWWQRGVVYQVYPRSFKDSNGDGTGDIKGIESELKYIKELGVNTLWLNPVYKSPMEDGGYDISDFKGIDPRFGTMDDFKSLVQSAHDSELHVVMEFVPNHSSDKHEWFVNSRGRVANYTDYYIWAKGVDGGPPNNWRSVFGGSAWTEDPVRGEYFYHQFLPSQPDLNLRNEAVLRELEDVLKFWLDLGVDGFRVDAVKHLFEEAGLPDEPPSNSTNGTPGTKSPEDYDSLSHIYTTGLPENLDVLRDWRKVLSAYEEKDGKHRLLMVEAYDDTSKVMSYYGNETDPLADFPFNFFLLNLNGGSTAKDVAAAVADWNDALPPGKWSNWVLGNHDVSRLATRVGSDLVDAYNAIVMLLGGTPVTYYGEEIGMANGHVPFGAARDNKGIRAGEAEFANHSRDFQRTPMQWSGERGAGFTNASVPWLPIGADYVTLNVRAQSGVPESHLEIYKKLVQLRKEPAVIYGKCYFPKRTPSAEDVFSFVRAKKGSPGYAVVVNFGRNESRVDMTKSGCCHDFDFPADGIVELRSGPDATAIAPKAKINFNGFALGPSGAVVIKFVPKFK